MRFFYWIYCFFVSFDRDQLFTFSSYMCEQRISIDDMCTHTHTHTTFYSSTIMIIEDIKTTFFSFFLSWIADLLPNGYLPGYTMLKLIIYLIKVFMQIFSLFVYWDFVFVHNFALFYRWNHINIFLLWCAIWRRSFGACYFVTMYSFKKLRKISPMYFEVNEWKPVNWTYI